MSRSRYSIFVALLVLASLIAASVFIPTSQQAQAHCQVPCGIYDDQGRIDQIREDATTIAKAIKLINELSQSKTAQDQNQLVRWINTKEAHASNIITTISEYFLTQKIKPVDSSNGSAYSAYLSTLASHHGVMVAAMKTKQKADPAIARMLVDAIEKMAPLYEHKH